MAQQNTENQFQFSEMWALSVLTRLFNKEQLLNISAVFGGFIFAQQII